MPLDTITNNDITEGDQAVDQAVALLERALKWAEDAVEARDHDGPLWLSADHDRDEGGVCRK